MDPPKVKPYSRDKAEIGSVRYEFLSRIAFYVSATMLTVVVSSSLVYVYVLQVRYKSEKFRCDTPFFHRRDTNETPNGTT